MWTVCASDVEWIEVEHVVKTETIADVIKKIERLQISLSAAQGESDKCDLTQKAQQVLTKLQRMTQTQRLKLKHTKTVTVKVKPNQMATTKMEFRCCMHQLSVKLNNATTGHTLQSMTKDFLTITSWPSGGIFKNWEYTVLSRVPLLDGLFLFKYISLEKSFAPSEEMKVYFEQAKRQEKAFLKERGKR